MFYRLKLMTNFNLPLVPWVDYVTSIFVVWVDRYECVALVAIQVIKGHGAVDDEGLLPFTLGPLRKSVNGNVESGE